MLNRMQIGALLALSAMFWIIATLYIRLFPDTLDSPVHGAIGFVTAMPVGWLSVRLTQKVAGLSADQLLPGVAIVGAAAMMLDGIALRWFPTAYSGDQLIVRLGAAWLLWGYGVSLWVAIIVGAAMQRRGAITPRPDTGLSRPPR